MKQKVVVFSQIDTDIQNKLEQNYQVSYIQPKLGDVNQQLLQQVQFLTYRFFTQLLTRHNEGPADITVFHETFTEFHAQHIGKF